MAVIQYGRGKEIGQADAVKDIESLDMRICSYIIILYVSTIHHGIVYSMQIKYFHRLLHRLM